MNLGAERVQELVERYANLPKRYRRAVIPVLLVLVGGAYWHFFFDPAQQELVRARARQLELQRKLSEARAVAANLPTFEAELELLERELTEALRQLPDSKELPILLTDISTVGKDAGLDFRAFRPRSETRRGFYAEVPIEVEFTGGFHEIAHFFDRIAKLPRIVTVGKVEMRIAHEGAFDTELRVEGSITTFRFLEEEAPAGDPPGGPKGRQTAQRPERQRRGAGA